MRILLITILFAAAGLSAQVGYAQSDTNQLTPEAFEAEADALAAKRDAKKITELQYAKGALALFQKYIPNNYEDLTLAEYRVMIATQLQKKKISEEEYRYLWAKKRNEYLDKRQKEKHEDEARRYLAEQEATAENRRRQQQYEDQLSRERAYADELERQQRVQSNAMILQGIGNAFTRTYQNPAVNCTSVPLGAGVTTTCR